MKSLSAELQTHLDSGSTSLCYLWRVVLTNGVVLAFTSHDQDVAYNGTRYLTRSGSTASAVKSASTNAIDDMQVDGFLEEAGISKGSIQGGLFRGARVIVMMVNWADTTMGHIVMRAGTIGPVQQNGRKFAAALHGLTQNLQNTIGRVDGPGCDLEFGGGDKGDGKAYCGFDIEAATVTASVDLLAEDRRAFFAYDLTVASPPPASGYFSNGLVTWITGLNAGLSMDVKNYSNTGAVELRLSMPFTIALGDSFEIKPGCLHRLVDCQTYDQVVNHGGIPDIPGTDAIFSQA